MKKLCAKCNYYRNKFCTFLEVNTCGGSSCVNFSANPLLKDVKVKKFKRKPQRKCTNCDLRGKGEDRLFCTFHNVPILETSGCCTYPNEIGEETGE